MSGSARAALVIAVLAIATLGEGGAAAGGLLAQHLLLAAAVALCAVWLPAPTYAPSRGPAAAWLAFAVLAAVGAVTAPYAYAAWLVLVEIFAFGAMAWLASGDRPGLERSLPPALALLAAGHGLFAVVQKLSGSARPASTFLNPNHLAAWLGAAALVLGGLVIGRDAGRGRWAYGAATIAALAGAAVTGSRGAVLELAAGGAVLAAMSLRAMSRRARLRLAAAAAVLAISMLTGLALRFRAGDDPYQFHRTRIWAASLRGALESPWLGTRAGQFAAAAPNMNFPLDDAPLRFERAFKTPHSDVLRAVVEFGFPAALAALTALLLGSAYVFEWRRGLSGLERGAAAALAGLCAQATVDDLSTRPALTMIGAALAGFLLCRRVERDVRSTARPWGAPVAALAVLALGLCEIAGYEGFRHVRELPRGRLDAAQLARLHRSIAWNPMQPDAWERLAEHEAGDPRTYNLAGYAAAREAAEHACRLQPKDALYARAAARIEATACLTLLPFEGNRRRAAHLYEDAWELARTDATIPLEAAKFLLATGDLTGARRFAEQALHVEPRAVAPRLVLAQAILRQEGAAGAGQAGRLVDEARALAPREGETPSSPYDAALRGFDPELVPR